MMQLNEYFFVSNNADYTLEGETKLTLWDGIAEVREGGSALVQAGGYADVREGGYAYVHEGGTSNVHAGG